MKNQKQNGNVSGQTLNGIILAKDEEFYDTAELKIMFKTSDSTLSRWRKKGELPFIKPAGKIFYPKSFFNDTLLERSLQELKKPQKK